MPRFTAGIPRINHRSTIPPALLARPVSLAVILASNFASTARAEVYEVKPGDEWSKLGPKLVAGDEVVLLEGVHVAAQFDGLVGEVGKPIVIRSHDKSALADIAPGREGLRLSNCRHVRVERVQVKNARRAGIVVDSIDDGVSEDIAIHDSLVLGVSGLVEQAGILVIGTQGVELRRSRVEDCAGAAVRLENSAGIALERMQLRLSAGKSSQYAIACLGDVRDLTIDDASITGAFGVGLSIGSVDAPRAPRQTREPAGFEPITAPRPSSDKPSSEKPSPDKSPAEKSPADKPPASTPARAEVVSVSDSLVRGCDRAFELGNCRATQVMSTTVIDPTNAIIRLSAAGSGPVGPELRFRGNIVTWKPGGVRQLIEIAPDVDPSRLVLGPNLWWSSELPAALPHLGPEANPFAGTVEVPQTTDIDPALDPRGRPTREEAKMYGRNL